MISLPIYGYYTTVNMPGYKSKKEGTDQVLIQPSSPSDPGYQWESKKKLTIDIKNESQKVNPSPAGDRKASIKSHARKHTKHRTEVT